MPRVFLNRSVQIQPKSWRDIGQVIFSRVLSSLQLLKDLAGGFDGVVNIGCSVDR